MVCWMCLSASKRVVGTLNEEKEGKMRGRKRDKIYLDDLRVMGVVGIFDWEKDTKKEISISYEIDHDNVSAAREDVIEATTDYKAISKSIMQLVEEKQVCFSRDVCRKDCTEVVLRDFDVNWITLKVSKPGAIRYSKDVGVIIERSKLDYE